LFEQTALLLCLRHAKQHNCSPYRWCEARQFSDSVDAAAVAAAASTFALCHLQCEACPKTQVLLTLPLLLPLALLSATCGLPLQLVAVGQIYCCCCCMSHFHMFMQQLDCGSLKLSWASPAAAASPWHWCRYGSATNVPRS
jgi:hypothetical protein